MRILIIGYYWSGKFTDYVADGFRQGGHEVMLIYENELSPLQRFKLWVDRYPRLARALRSLVARARGGQTGVYATYRTAHRQSRQGTIVRRAKRFNPDIVVLVQGAMIAPEVLAALKQELHLPIGIWFGDNPLHWTDGTYDAKWRFFDEIFIVEPSWAEGIRRFTSAPITPLSLATTTMVHHPIADVIDSKYKAEVAFVAAASDERAETISQIADLPVRVFGPRWDLYFKKYPELKPICVGAITPAEVNLVYNASKINLGLYAREIKNSVGQRLFDVGASGGFLLTEAKDQIYELFPREMIVDFRSIAELREKIRYYLAHEDERKKIAAAFHVAVVNGHTFTQRTGVIAKKLAQRIHA